MLTHSLRSFAGVWCLVESRRDVTPIGVATLTRNNGNFANSYFFFPLFISALFYSESSRFEAGKHHGCFSVRHQAYVV